MSAYYGVTLPGGTEAFHFNLIARTHDKALDVALESGLLHSLLDFRAPRRRVDCVDSLKCWLMSLNAISHLTIAVAER